MWCCRPLQVHLWSPVFTWLRLPVMSDNGELEDKPPAPPVRMSSTIFKDNQSANHSSKPLPSVPEERKARNKIISIFSEKGECDITLLGSELSVTSRYWASTHCLVIDWRLSVCSALASLYEVKVGASSWDCLWQWEPGCQGGRGVHGSVGMIVVSCDGNQKVTFCLNIDMTLQVDVRKTKIKSGRRFRLPRILNTLFMSALMQSPANLQ